MLCRIFLHFSLILYSYHKDMFNKNVLNLILQTVTRESYECKYQSSKFSKRHRLVVFNSIYNI